MCHTEMMVGCPTIISVPYSLFVYISPPEVLSFFVVRELSPIYNLSDDKVKSICLDVPMLSLHPNRKTVMIIRIADFSFIGRADLICPTQVLDGTWAENDFVVLVSANGDVVPMDWSQVLAWQPGDSVTLEEKVYTVSPHIRKDVAELRYKFSKWSALHAFCKGVKDLQARVGNTVSAHCLEQAKELLSIGRGCSEILALAQAKIERAIDNFWAYDRNPEVDGEWAAEEAVQKLKDSLPKETLEDYL
jgi:hypothetical protein